MKGFLDEAWSKVFPDKKPEAAKSPLTIVRRASKPEPVQPPIVEKGIMFDTKAEDVKKWEEYMSNEIKYFVYSDYLRPLKTPVDYLLELSKENLPPKLRERFTEELAQAEERSSWEKYRATYFAKLESLNKKCSFVDPFDPKSEGKQPISKEIQRQLLILKAMGEYENVFVPDPERNFDQRLVRAMSYLLLAQKEGSLSFLKRTTRINQETGVEEDTYIGLHDYHVDMAFNDVLYLCQQRGLINDDLKYTEYRQNHLRGLIERMGEANGKENEYRAVYLAQINNIPLIHSTPFQDHEASGRSDMILFDFNGESIDATFLQTKSGETLTGDVVIPDVTKQLYDKAVEFKDKASSVATRWYKKFQEAVEKGTKIKSTLS